MGSCEGGTCILAKFFEMHVNSKSFAPGNSGGYVYFEDFFQNTRNKKELQAQELQRLRVCWRVSSKYT